MKISTEILLELTRLNADIGALANKTAQLNYEIYKSIRFEDEEASGYGADADCKECSE